MNKSGRKRKPIDECFIIPEDALPGVRKLYAAAKALYAKGMVLSDVARQLKFSMKTISEMYRGVYNPSKEYIKYVLSDEAFRAPEGVDAETLATYKRCRELAEKGCGHEEIGDAIGWSAFVVKKFKAGLFKTMPKENRRFERKRPLKEQPAPKVFAEGTGQFGCFSYADGVGECECGETFALKPHHLKYARECWHYERQRQLRFQSRISRRFDNTPV